MTSKLAIYMSVLYVPVYDCTSRKYVHLAVREADSKRSRKQIESHCLNCSWIKPRRKNVTYCNMNFEKCSAHHQITVCLSTMNLSEPTYASYVCIKFMGYSAGYSFVVPGYIRWFFVRPWESLNCYGWPKWVHQWLGGSWLKLDKKTSGSPGRGFVKHCPP